VADSDRAGAALAAAHAFADSERNYRPSPVDALLAAVEAALELHRPQEVPVSRICPAHASGPLWRASATLAQFRDEIEVCSDCLTEPDVFCAECRDENWPCPTYAAITRALTGEDGCDERP
jgi:hypothetical protein